MTFQKLQIKKNIVKTLIRNITRNNTDFKKTNQKFIQMCYILVYMGK